MASKHLLAGAGLAASVCLMAASASAGTWDNVYGDTIVSTYDNGKVVKVHVNADHTYAIATPDGQTLKGTWADGADKSCFTLTDPPQAPGTAPVCFAARAYKVGDTFSGTDATGHFDAVIEPGH